MVLPQAEEEVAASSFFVQAPWLYLGAFFFGGGSRSTTHPGSSSPPPTGQAKHASTGEPQSPVGRKHPANYIFC